jgi:hypothetical protein
VQATAMYSSAAWLMWYINLIRRVVSKTPSRFHG